MHPPARPVLVATAVLVALVLAGFAFGAYVANEHTDRTRVRELERRVERIATDVSLMRE